MHGIVRSVEIERGVVWVECCGLSGEIVPALIKPESAAMFEVGQLVVYWEGKRAMGIHLPSALETDVTTPSIVCDPVTGKVIK
jgi:hypothetical protein